MGHKDQAGAQQGEGQGYHGLMGRPWAESLALAKVVLAKHSSAL